MREIKFRGQDFVTGEWLYGSYNGVNAGAADVFIIYEKEIFDPVSFGFIGTEIVEKEVKEETVGQYTGLKDKKGVEIYEGDIVKDSTTKTYLGGKKIILRRGQVKYGDYYAVADDPYCSADVTGFYIDGDVLSSNLKDYSDKELEVIGNIYEHGHLLENESKN